MWHWKVSSQPAPSFLRSMQRVAALACMAAACGDSPVTPTGPAEVRSATVNSVTAALARTLDVRLDRPYGVEVQYWTDGGPRLRVTDDAPQETHDLVPGRLQVSRSDEFIGQHTTAELSPVGGRRRVLLFDNGPVGRGFSRAQELELDFDAGIATTAWEFRPTPDNFSFITSLARRLPNGNTFVAFGAGPDARSSFGPVEVFEVDPSGAVQFRIEVGGPNVNDLFILYRASPLSDIAGEDTVS